jgi:hypothetical protein
MIALISGRGLIELLLVLIVLGVILYIIWFLVNRSPLPPLFKTVLVWIIYLIGALILINTLLGLIGKPLIDF